jgi:hypothetical protein
MVSTCKTRCNEHDSTVQYSTDSTDITDTDSSPFVTNGEGSETALTRSCKNCKSSSCQNARRRSTDSIGKPHASHCIYKKPIGQSKYYIDTHTKVHTLGKKQRKSVHDSRNAHSECPLNRYHSSCNSVEVIEPLSLEVHFRAPDGSQQKQWALVDNGSCGNFISIELVRSTNMQVTPEECAYVTAAGGQRLEYQGSVTLDLAFGEYECRVKLYVLEISIPIIVGRPFLKLSKAQIDCDKGTCRVIRRLDGRFVAYKLPNATLPLKDSEMHLSQSLGFIQTQVRVEDPSADSRVMFCNMSLLQSRLVRKTGEFVHIRSRTIPREAQVSEKKGVENDLETAQGIMTLHGRPILIASIKALMEISRASPTDLPSELTAFQDVFDMKPSEGIIPERGVSHKIDLQPGA